jgi:hypothetical protein
VGAISAAGVEMSKATRTTLGRSCDPTRASHSAADPALMPTVNLLADRCDSRSCRELEPEVPFAQPLTDAATERARRAASTTRTRLA